MSDVCSYSNQSLICIPKHSSIPLWHNNLVAFGGQNQELELTNNATKIKIDRTRKMAECVTLDCRGSGPSPRHSHSACFNTVLAAMVVSGGRDQQDRFLEDLHLLYLGSLTWAKVHTQGVTIPRAMHQVASPHAVLQHTVRPVLLRRV